MRYIWLIVLAGIIAGGCTRFQRLRKSEDWHEKYEAALAYYQDKDYYRSSTLLEEVLPVIRGTQEAELANFYFAYSYFYQDQFILSAHYFQTFAEVYSRSEYALEAEYMHAYSLYMQSPNYRLDQTVTLEAIGAFQAFINKYPYSDYAVETEKLIEEMQEKLEQKAFESAKLYHKIRRYEAALVAFDNFQKDFPDSHFNEEVGFLIVETSFAYAEVSIRSRQEERYQNTVDGYQKFVDEYPDSKFLKDAEKYYDESVKELTKFASQN